jgi:polyhydroxyalkanoate synthesis regulator phasin
MIDLLKKTLLTGVGVAALTKEKIEELAKDFVEKGKISEQEGKAFVDDLIARSDESREAFQNQVEEKVQSVLTKMNLAKQSEVDALKVEVETLQKALNDQGWKNS